MPENIAHCHEILTENGVPLKGPFAPLSLADRITYLAMLLDTFKDANYFLRKENDEIRKKLDKATFAQR